MATSFTARTALNLALVAATAASLSACTRPKPTFPTQPATPAPSTTPAPTTPDTAPPAGPVGSATVPGSQQDFVVNVGDTVLFDFDSYSIREDARGILAAQAGWLKQYPAVRVRIEGNTDELGTREYNLALGARRANAVREFLVSNGVGGDRISTISFGKERPVDPGTGDEAYARNRNAKTAIVGGAR